MKNLFLSFIIFILISGSVFSQTNSDTTNIFNGLKFEIKESNRNNVDIFIDIILTNISDTTYYLNTWIFLHPALLEAKIINPSGQLLKQTIPIKYNMKIIDIDDFKLLSPGDTFITKVSIEKNKKYDSLFKYKLFYKDTYKISILYFNDSIEYYCRKKQKMIKLDNVWEGKLWSNAINVSLKNWN